MAGVLQVAILLAMKTTIDVQWRAILGPATVKVVVGVRPEDTLQATKMNAVVPLWEDFLRSPTAVDTTGVLQVSILLVMKTTIDVQWRAILGPATVKVVVGVRPEDTLQATKMNAVVPLWEDFLRSVTAVDTTGVLQVSILLATKTTIDVQWRAILRPATAKVVAGVRPEDILQARTMNAVVPLREDFLRSVGAKIDILRVGRAAIVVAIQWKDILQMPTETDEEEAEILAAALFAPMAAEHKSFVFAMPPMMVSKKTKLPVPRLKEEVEALSAELSAKYAKFQPKLRFRDVYASLDAFEVKMRANVQEVDRVEETKEMDDSFMDKRRAVWQRLNSLPKVYVAVDEICELPAAEKYVGLDGLYSVRPVRDDEVKHHMQEMKTSGFLGVSQVVLCTPGPNGF
ncbi:hypothetical protein H257_18944, partial [Aphanomyces astaci]